MRCRALFAGLLLSASVFGQTTPPDAATVEYLHRLERPAGGYAPAATPADAPASLRATSSAVRALKYLGAVPRRADAHRQFVRNCRVAATGGFADAPGHPASVYATAVGLMACVELKIPLDGIREPAVAYLDANVKTLEDIRIAAAALEAIDAKSTRREQWLAQIAAARNADGTYGAGAERIRQTGGMLALQLRLGDAPANRNTLAGLLRDGQSPDGAYTNGQATDLETTYRVVRALVMMNDKPADPAKLSAYIGRCRTPDGGYGVAPGQPASAAGCYFAAILNQWK